MTPALPREVLLT